jgi:hypothetical protein
MGVVLHACNPSPWERRRKDQDFETNLRCCLKKEKKTKDLEKSLRTAWPWKLCADGAQSEWPFFTVRRKLKRNKKL